MKIKRNERLHDKFFRLQQMYIRLYNKITCSLHRCKFAHEMYMKRKDFHQASKFQLDTWGQLKTYKFNIPKIR